MGQTKFIWILSLTLTLSACSHIKPAAETVPSTLPKTTWPTREAALNQIQGWQLSGKIAVQSAHDSGSASLSWFQHQRQYAISLQGPLGANAMKLTGSGGQVTLQLSDGKSYHATSPEQLLARQWGFHLPISNMRYWIRGLPVPGIPATTRFDQNNRLSSLIQQGYRVDFLSYANVGRMDLPEKISITSPSLRVKIIVYQWNPFSH